MINKMWLHRKSLRLQIAAAILLTSIGTASAVMLSDRHDIVPQANNEGRLVIYSATDEHEATELISSFHDKYPKISVDYRSLTAADVYQRFMAESKSGHIVADMLINSAMDLQIKLVNDGYAQRYISPERRALPSWAVWKSEAFAISTEPIVMGYNARLLAPNLVPRTHDELASLLHRRPDIFTGRIGSYDPERSPTGYLYITQDVENDRDGWDLIAAVGRARPILFVSSHDMIKAVSDGRLVLAYNLIGSYAFESAAKDPNFRVVVPQDYALMMSRVALITRGAPHPAAARLFLDFLLSKSGQSIMARHHMTPVRLDVASHQPWLGSTNVRAVRVGPALMAGLDTLTFAGFTRKWLDAVSDRPKLQT
ncbi:ABC transporter substrate-binding protein [Sphingomonas koreensis]|nr:ABC transporter substrate-binding protein [Sphingomonas koreensis]